MSFRLATKQDMNALLAWDTWLAQRFADRGQVLATDAGGMLAGLLHVHHRDGLIELSWIVAPHARNQGIGKRMVAQFASTTTKWLYAAVPLDNIFAQRIAVHAGLTKSEDVNGMAHFSRLPS